MIETIYPAALNPGDLIRIVCPSGHLEVKTTEKLIEILKEWGFMVECGKTVGNGEYYFSGTDEERRIDLQTALDDEEVKAIIMGRGGYGMSKIIDDIDFTKFQDHPKWIVGFSDITVLLNHLYEQFNIASIHGPMAAQFQNAESEEEIQSIHVLEKIFHHQWKGYVFENQHELNQYGSGEGVLVGGNLSLITHAIGTDSAIDFRNKILFIEDIGEYRYGVDRILTQLKRVGAFDKIKGLIVGQFTDIKDTTRPYGEDLENIIASYVKHRNIPVCFGFESGHESINYPLIIGGEYDLSIDNQVVVLQLMHAYIS